jgi:Tol biopolymer transport system component/DNA-binding winged helix-turn-helix (wHTH) protein
MEDFTNSRKVARFGLFEVDFKSQELRKSGIRIKIQDQPFQILAMLLEHPGEIVTRGEIQKRLWANDTFVDFDLGLSSAVRKLRQALGDESDNPRFVETLYRRGYRFLAPVQTGMASAVTIVSFPPEPSISCPSIAAIPAQQQPEKPAPRQPTAPRFVHLLLPILLGFGLLGGYWLRPGSAPRITGYQQITHDGRQKFRLATDGERLYVGENDSGHFVISQVSAAGGETSILRTPFINVFLGTTTPDGTALLIGASPGLNKQLPVWSLPLPAGAPRRMGDLVAESIASSPDGEWFIYARQDAVYEARADGGQTRKLFSIAGDTFDLAVSPDGNRLSFSLTDTRTDNSSIWMAGRDGTNPHALFSNDVDSQHDACEKWTPDGKYLLFVRYSHGHNNIWVLPVGHFWFNRHPKAIQLTNGPLDFSEPLPSRDGKRIFALGAQPRTELIRYDQKSGFGTFLDGLSITDLDFSADGQWVTYVTVPDKALWRSRIDGSDPMQLTDPGKVAAGLPRWSPDGKQIVFAGRIANANWRAFLISANGGTFQDLAPNAQGGMDPSWMPDGKTIVLTLSNLGSTWQGISVLDLESRKVHDLPGTGHLFSPRVSPDGRSIAAITTDGQALMLFDIASQHWTELVRLPIGYPSWSHDGRYIYFDSIFTEDPAFYRVAIADHKLERLTSLAGIRRFWSENGEWSGLAPDDSLLLTRDASPNEVYAIDWQPD